MVFINFKFPSSTRIPVVLEIPQKLNIPVLIGFWNGSNQVTAEVLRIAHVCATFIF